MHKFDTRVQNIKHNILKEVAREEFAGTLQDNLLDLPERIQPGRKATTRCCVYKERAIVKERIKIAMGKGDHVIQVIDIACDECPMTGYEVTDLCRGCLAHRCEAACRFGCISFDENMRAHIDKTKCKNCGACSKACPFNAIRNYKRPCASACKADAIGVDEYGACSIDYNKCVSCGSCVYHCPFGAIADRSMILKVVDMIKDVEAGKDETIIAVIAPALPSQFVYAKQGQVIEAILKVGFTGVIEAALGADIVTRKESEELAEKGFLTSSCCPAFVKYIKTQFPDLAEHISSNFSPMAEICKYIKKQGPKCKTVFIGPCTAKKMEVEYPEVAKYVDAVMTFEELQALFKARGVDPRDIQEESYLEDASKFGRTFARVGGLTEAVVEAIKEFDIDFEAKAVVCSGLEECKVALLKKSKGLLDANFIEGMACEGGCVNGAGCLTHGVQNKVLVERIANAAGSKTINEILEPLNIDFSEPHEHN